MGFLFVDWQYVFGGVIMKFLFLYHYYKERIKDKNRVEFPPLGMLYVCSMLESIGVNVEVFYFDENTTIEDFPEADVYAYSISSTASYPSFLEVAPKICDKAKLHVAGNTHATIFPYQLLEELNLDVVFTGAGEESVKKWVLGGMLQRGVINGQQLYNLDIPFPARHLIPDNKIYMQDRVGGMSKNSISMISSRGCVFECMFCAIQNRGKVAFRTISDFENEVNFILSRYPKCDGITLLDETFTLRVDHAVGIADVFKKYGLNWECNSRADTINKPTIQSMISSNCIEIRIGIETGSQMLLDKMKKGIDLEKTRLILMDLKKAGLNVKIYLMHGYPGECMRTTGETIKYLNRIKKHIDRISLYRFAPLPGSPVYYTDDIKKREWLNYTIYQNNSHWWGSIKNYEEMEKAYYILENEVYNINQDNKRR